MLLSLTGWVRVRGLVLVAATVFLALALGTYDPVQWPSSTAYPPAPASDNACGVVGAWVAWVAVSSLGLGAYFAWLSLAIVAALGTAGRTIDDPWVRLLGWLVALVGWCTLAQLALPRWSPGPVVGAGGYVGAVMAHVLTSWLALPGAWLVAMSLFWGGMLLCADYWVFRVLGWGLKGAAWTLTWPWHRKRSPGTASPEPDSQDGPERSHPPSKAEQGEESASEPEATSPAATVRIKHRTRVRPSEPPSRLEIVDTPAGEDDQAYEFPPLELLLPPDPVPEELQEQEIIRKAQKLEKTFADFGFRVQVVEVETGPVISRYEVQLEAGLRLSKILSLADDLAVALRVPSVRIVAPVPGKNTVAIEVPNSTRQLVRLREVIEEASDAATEMCLPLFLGKDVAGNPLVVDLTQMPHLLIAGRTGTGKSVCLNSLIMSILMTRSPREVKLLLIDPKMVELSPYGRVPHLMHPVVTDMKKAEAILGWAVEKMEQRYRLLMQARVRHIAAYNRLGRQELLRRMELEEDSPEAQEVPEHLPYIVIVADEMADLMMTAPKEVESYIIRLAQKSRAVGIHLILATQKPTVDVITGLIKSNLPARISFQVASRTDSRVVLDEMGAERLLGNGDMLFLWPGTSTLLRGQGCYVSDEEIQQVVQFVGRRQPEFAEELVQLEAAPSGSPQAMGKARDELYEAAVEVVVREGRGSVSLLQRALGIGYGRAARLIDFMAEDGIVGPYNGSQAREVLITAEQWALRRQGSQSNTASSAPKRRRVVLRPSHVQESQEQDPLNAWPSPPHQVRCVRPGPDSKRGSPHTCPENADPSPSEPSGN